MTITLSEDTSRTLTDMVLNQWKKDGVKSRFLGWVEIHHLAEHFLKICREQNQDYQAYDFYTMIDSNLFYEENRAQIDNQIGGLLSEKETEATNKLKDYLTEEEMKAYTPQEKTVIESVETTNKTLTKKLGQITKKLESQQTQQFDTEEIKRQIKQVQNDKATIIAKLAAIPDLDNKIETLLASPSFKDVGKELKNIIQKQTQLTEKPTQTKPKKPHKPISQHITEIAAFIPTGKTILHTFAGTLILTAYVAISALTIQSFNLSWGWLLALAIFWLSFPLTVKIINKAVID